MTSKRINWLILLIFNKLEYHLEPWEVALIEKICFLKHPRELINFLWINKVNVRVCDFKIV
jgi:hypothetical protein